MPAPRAAVTAAPERLWIVGVASFTLTLAVLITFAAISPIASGNRFVMTAGLTMIATNFVLPIKFRVAIPMSFVNIALYFGILLILGGSTRLLEYHDILGFYSAATLITTVVTYYRERVQKEAFLLHLNKDRQTEELAARVDELTQISYRDPLTGAGNRRSFDMRLDALWRTATLHGEPIALIMIDVDHFKPFNDAVGHAAGDECLKAVAKAIAAGRDARSSWYRVTAARSLRSYSTRPAAPSPSRSARASRHSSCRIPACPRPCRDGQCWKGLCPARPYRLSSGRSDPRGGRCALYRQAPGPKSRGGREQGTDTAAYAARTLRHIDGAECRYQDCAQCWPDRGALGLCSKTPIQISPRQASNLPQGSRTLKP